MSIKYPLLIFVGINLIANAFSAFMLFCGIDDNYRNKLIEEHGADSLKVLNGVLITAVILSLILSTIGFIGVAADNYYIVIGLGVAEIFVFILRLFGNHFGLFHLLLSLVIGILSFYFAKEISDRETLYTPPQPDYVVKKEDRKYLVP